MDRFDLLEGLKEEFERLKPLSETDLQRLENKFRLEFNFNSNHLEGNTLTYQETELLLIFDETRGNHTKRELDEMQAHNVAYRLIQDWAKDKDRPLTEADIR